MEVVGMVFPIQAIEPHAIGEFFGCFLSGSSIACHGDHAARERNGRKSQSGQSSRRFAREQRRMSGNVFFSTFDCSERVKHGVLLVRAVKGLLMASQDELACPNPERVRSCCIC